MSVHTHEAVETIYLEELRKFIAKRARDSKERDAAFGALFALAENNASLRRDCLALSKLAADTPQFHNPLVAWEAKATRDRYLAGA